MIDSENEESYIGLLTALLKAVDPAITDDGHLSVRAVTPEKIDRIFLSHGADPTAL